MVEKGKKAGWSKNIIARKVAMDIFDGAYVNLGIGLPELVAGNIPEGREVIFHTENGLLGMDKPAEPGKEDLELVNAGKKYVTAIPGAAYFHHADSFAMIRGGHIDICVLGAYQISEEGDLANWSTGNPDDIPAVGGAMDLVAGVDTIFVMTKFFTRSGEPKIVKECTYPLTGKKVVSRIYSDLAVIDVKEGRLLVRELAPGVTFDFLQKSTDAKLFSETE